MHSGAVLDLLQSVTARTDALVQARRLYADRLAPGFNTLDFLRVDELGLSRILAWLLNPNETHAQGTAFLAAFIATFAPEWSHFSLDAVGVQLEAPCSAGGRLDVLISGPDWRLAIENKPFAGDQNLQLTRYLATIDAAKYGKLIYLAGNDGQGPSEDSISASLRDERLDAGDLVISSYSELKPWLDLCRGACKAERVRSFIDDVQRHILHQFEGYSDLTEKTAVIDAILTSRQTIEAAGHVASGWTGARETLIETLNSQLRTAAEEKGWIANYELGSSSGIFDLVEPSLPGLGFTLEFEKSGYRSFCWGICLDEADVEESARLRAIIVSSEFGEALGPTDEWPWWRKGQLADNDLAVPHDWNGPEAWVAIRENALAPQIVAAAERMFAALKADRA